MVSNYLQKMKKKKMETLMQVVRIYNPGIKIGFVGENVPCL